MRINVLQHTPNEGPGSIALWSQTHGHEMTVYHPAQFNGVLPSVADTDLLVILGGPMSPNDDLDWIKEERTLILEMLAAKKPIYGACYGAQQIAKALGAKVLDAPAKEVGWAQVTKESDRIPGLPETLVGLHWHEQMFEIPDRAELLFSTDLVKNQGFVFDNVIGLQFHFEPMADNVREMVANDGAYAADPANALHQSGQDILAHGVPSENQKIMFTLLDYLVQESK
ncbi:GMP synthase glutamine amidotransferase subunit [Fructobacillus pseudoficulneus]|uniref:GMP synthase glutamine amidotransferase subunit n=1 Tax=Fructobacillus pseudoficulneus TaxID=220714 RepID=A0A3F3GUU5_9LACO|nr:type 1 glutamine amidotransferase [Fructobacillus pseudoficulneus]GAP02132.1 GMP synthase glutamine amidotransferase subunit [Fructobacillus pseudoficulneus]SEH35829.1 GMP synthase-Glutamine amidotransferase [Fructobacillus pseudoficulneus]